MTALSPLASPALAPSAQRPRRRPGLPALLLATLAVGGCTSDPSATADTLTDAAGDAADAASDAAPDTTAAGGLIVINEVHVDGADDWIELYNAGDAAVDLSGWTLRDDDPTHLFTFGGSTLVPPGVFYLLGRDPDIGFDFGLGDADSALLYHGDTLVDAITWVTGEAPPGFSYGRFPDGTGPFMTLFTPSPGTPNPANATVTCGDGLREGLEVCDDGAFGGLDCAALGFAPGGTLACVDDCARVSTAGCTSHASTLVINEVSAVGDDRIELFNGTAAAVDLTGWSLVDGAANRWIFAPAMTVAPGAYLVLVKGVDHDFGLGGDDLVELHDASDAVIDRSDWADGQADPAWCRVPDGTGGFQTCTTPSFGGPNPAP